MVEIVFWPNAAPEWQAGSLGWRSNGLMVACPLKGRVLPLIKRKTQHFQLSSQVPKMIGITELSGERS
jgi:hypothetical protein